MFSHQPVLKKKCKARNSQSVISEAYEGVCSGAVVYLRKPSCVSARVTCFGQLLDQARVKHRWAHADSEQCLSAHYFASLANTILFTRGFRMRVRRIVSWLLNGVLALKYPTWGNTSCLREWNPKNLFGYLTSEWIALSDLWEVFELKVALCGRQFGLG